MLICLSPQGYVSSGRPLPFGQLQLEVHVWGKKFDEFLSWWEKLEAAGLRPFWTEPNLVYQNYNKQGNSDLAEVRAPTYLALHSRYLPFVRAVSRSHCPSFALSFDLADITRSTPSSTCAAATSSRTTRRRWAPLAVAPVVRVRSSLATVLGRGMVCGLSAIKRDAAATVHACHVGHRARLSRRQRAQSRGRSRPAR